MQTALHKRSTLTLSVNKVNTFKKELTQKRRAKKLRNIKVYRFTGKERDSESGLYYYGARYYVPWLCRFLSVDPKAAQFPNQSSYNYCFNNPINLIDPDGQAPTGGEDPPKGSANNPVVLPEVEVTATRTYPSAVSTGGVTPNVSNKQISGCEDCKVEGLEDGDYFSDVQDQFYTATFSNISREGFEKFKQQVQKDPGKIINNDLAEYSLVDRDGSGGVSKGDHFDIDIKGPDNGFVVVDKIVNTKNYLSITVNTLEGHPDAGTNTFSVYYDEKAKTLTWTTHNISRSNDAMSQGVGSGIVGARGLQQDQWKNVILKVSDFLGNPSVKSSWAIVKEFDYNDYTNKMGKEEKGESFTENLLPLFNRK